MNKKQCLLFMMLLSSSSIVLWKLNLNEQEDFERLVLFRNGVI